MNILEGTPAQIAANLAELLGAATFGDLQPWIEDEDGHKARLRDERQGIDLGPTPVRIERIPQGIALVVGSQKTAHDPTQYIISRAQVPGKRVAKLILGDFEFDLPSEEGPGRAHPHEVNLQVCLPILITASSDVYDTIWGLHRDV